MKSRNSPRIQVGEARYRQVAEQVTHGRGRSVASVAPAGVRDHEDRVAEIFMPGVERQGRRVRHDSGASHMAKGRAPASILVAVLPLVVGRGDQVASLVDMDAVAARVL